MTVADLLGFIAASKGTQGRKDVLSKRIKSPDAAYLKASGTLAQLQLRLLNDEHTAIADAAEARSVALALTGLARPLIADAAKLRALLLRCLDVTGEGTTQVGRSEVRKAIARLDELTSPW